jgi:hypothetical protein
MINFTAKTAKQKLIEIDDNLFFPKTSCGKTGEILFEEIPKFYNISEKDIKINFIEKINKIDIIDNIDNFEILKKQIKNTNLVIKFEIYINVFVSENRKIKKYFGGHCFIIWKFGNNKYILAQSYINEYFFKDTLKVLDTNQVLKIISNMEYFLNSDIIDLKIITDYENLTNISIKHLLNYSYFIDNISKGDIEYVILDNYDNFHNFKSKL